VTEPDWLSSESPQEMLAFLRGTGIASERKLRLFATACCRRIWDSWEHYSGERRAVEVVERFADGLATAAEVRSAGYASEPIPIGGEGEGGAGHNATRLDAWDAASVVARIVWVSLGGQKTYEAEQTGLVEPAALDAIRSRTEETEKRNQARLLRDFFGPLPFREAHIDPGWIAWQGGTVKRLAEQAYQERRLPEGALDPGLLAVLSDALSLKL
jgi:hypothetical protein